MQRISWQIPLLTHRMTRDVALDQATLAVELLAYRNPLRRRQNKQTGGQNHSVYTRYERRKQATGR